MSLIDDIRKDREAGTPGPWDRQGDHKYNTDFGVFSKNGRAVCSSGGYSDGKETTYEENKANARRIARVPDMEAALLAADELADAIAMSKPWDEIDACLTAYRKATGSE